MSTEELLSKIKQLEEKNAILEKELTETKEHLKKYTAPLRNKMYYEQNKEQHKQRVKEYNEKTNYHSTISAEKKKEYARTAYLNKKEKLKQLNEKFQEETI
jgi:hypothetical protein